MSFLGHVTDGLAVFVGTNITAPMINGLSLATKLLEYFCCPSCIPLRDVVHLSRTGQSTTL
jgi:hypothetical protein